MAATSMMKTNGQSSGKSESGESTSNDDIVYNSKGEPMRRLKPGDLVKLWLAGRGDGDDDCGNVDPPMKNASEGGDQALVTVKQVQWSQTTQRNPLNGRPFTPQYYELLKQRKSLPVMAYREQFRELLPNHNALVIVGETGSGKTTQIPKWCMFYLRRVVSGFQGRMVGCTQPRRVAAISVATRVAKELDVALGVEVGYSVRFEGRTSEKTVLKYLTDGMLLREAISDPLLKSYGVVVIDEAHERTLTTDTALGLLKKIMAVRQDFKVIIMSATLKAEKFQAFFGNCPLLVVQGRTFPVEIVYEPKKVKDYVGAAVQKVVEIHKKEPAGDILVFLTGEDDIEQACNKITVAVDRLGPAVGDLRCIPLYSALPMNHQQRIFEPPPPAKPNGSVGRKCVVATNIAETSLTIDGIVYVIDCGYTKQDKYISKFHIDSLLVQDISQASAAQRAGRAGRTRPGKCYRLYKDTKFKSLQVDTCPEILRSDLSSVVLLLKKLRIQNLSEFGFVDQPQMADLQHATQLLQHLGALDEHAELTALGSKMAEFPLDPRLSKTLLASCDFGCSEQMVSIAAMLSVPPCFVRPRNLKEVADKIRNKHFGSKHGDHFALLKVFTEFQRNFQDFQWCQDKFLNYRALMEAVNIREQLVRLMGRLRLPLKDNLVENELLINVRKALVSGYFTKIARRSRKTHSIYVLMNGLNVKLHPSAVMDASNLPNYVIYEECRLTMGGICLRVASAVEWEWVLNAAPRYFKDTSILFREDGKDMNGLHNMPSLTFS